MRAMFVAAVLLATIVSVNVSRAQPPTKAAPAAAASAAHYTTSDTDIGTLLDDPAAHAIVDRYLPGVLSGDQIDMARGMTLKAIQPYASDRITDKALADIDTELAKLPPKK
jgi:hypothetical protein